MQDYTTKEAQPQHFKKDEVVDFFDRYAETPPGVAPEHAEGNRIARAHASEKHFVNRGVAVPVEQERQQTRSMPQHKPFQPPAQPEPPRAAQHTETEEKKQPFRQEGKK